MRQNPTVTHFGFSFPGPDEYDTGCWQTTRYGVWLGVLKTLSAFVLSKFCGYFFMFVLFFATFTLLELFYNFFCWTPPLFRRLPRSSGEGTTFWGRRGNTVMQISLTTLTFPKLDKSNHDYHYFQVSLEPASFSSSVRWSIHWSVCSLMPPGSSLDPLVAPWPLVCHPGPLSVTLGHY